MSKGKSPAEDLAALTVDRLIKSGLFRADRRAALVAKIASGAMKGDDWKSEIDLALLKKAKP